MSFNGPLRHNPVNPRYFTDNSGQCNLFNWLPHLGSAAGYVVGK